MQRSVIFFIIIILLILPINLALSASLDYCPCQTSLAATLEAYDGDFKIDIPPDTYSALDVYVFQKSAGNLPAGVKLVSQVYDYYISAPEVTDDSIFNITLGYQSNLINAKNIYQWNYQEKKWEPWPSITNSEKQTVSSIIKGRKGKVLVLENSDLESNESEINYHDQFYLSLPDTLENIQTITEIRSFSDLYYPEGKIRKSNIYQFDIKASQTFDLSVPVELTIKISDNKITRKAFYYWDNNQASWVYLPSWTNYYDGTVSAYTHLPFSRVALFEEPGQFVGEASWYAWKYGNYAASRDYPKGTQIKVTNITRLSNNFGKSVIVTINDYGPQESTGRIIDLDKTAYSQIGYLSGGVMAVRIEEIDN